MHIQGNIRKMRTEHKCPVAYYLPIGQDEVAMNPLIGKKIIMTFLGDINCIHCGRDTNKSFSQGYCYPCFRSLAQCDQCIVKPELCHFAAGTCRQPEWGQEHCMIEHVIYLANSSGLKVGITRHSQVPTRWMDQGAIQALPLFRVQKRLDSGVIEVALAQHVADKTNWRRMLKNDVIHLDMLSARDTLLEQADESLSQALDQVDNASFIADAQAYTFEYPVLEYPEKVTSLSFDKSARVEGELRGIKGQYLIFDTGVINMRKFAGYQIAFEV